MSEFDALLSGGKSKPKAPTTGNFMEVEGWFSCQMCNLEIEDARYYPAEKVLAWICADGHKSQIEEFSL